MVPVVHKVLLVLALKALLVPKVYLVLLAPKVLEAYKV
jgi:hypothetical protein